tara:strand:- start:1059 stop:1160 length:102 start_codon:yes stop_codon:yes gene_type:complete
MAAINHGGTFYRLDKIIILKGQARNKFKERFMK